MEQLQIPIQRKAARLETEPCIVEAVEELSAEAYAHFSQNLMEDYPFLEEHESDMFGAEDGAHCLLVLGERQEDGIVVDSEGYSYARYTGYLPCARTLLEHTVKQTADHILSRHAEEEQIRLSFLQIQREENLPAIRSRYVQNLLAAALRQDEAVRSVRLSAGRVNITFSAGQIQKHEPELSL